MKKLPPHSNEVEQTVLASIFLDGVVTIQAALDKKVTEDSFFNEQNRLLWLAMIWAFKRGTPLEIDAISTALLEKDKLGKVGGTEYLIKVCNRVPTTAGTIHAIEKLQELYMLREIISRSNQLIENAHEFNGDFSVFTAQIEDALRIREGLEKQLTLNDACDSINDRLDRIARGELKEGDNGMAWPWKDATRYLGPIQNGELVIIAARPSRGKSSVARQLAWCWSQRYGNVMLFSREMPVGELPPLFAQSLSGSSWREARNGRLTLKEVEALKEGMKEVKSNLALKVFDRDRTISQVLARVKAQCLQAKPCAVIIDYLQIYDPELNKGETLDAGIGRMSMALKDLAVSMGIVVIALAQLNRSVEKEERTPRLSDLRSSGSLEQDADRVAFISWNSTKANGEAQDFNDQNVIEIESQIIQAKGRGEGQAVCDLRFHRGTATFKSLG